MCRSPGTGAAREPVRPRPPLHRADGRRGFDRARGALRPLQRSPLLAGAADRGRHVGCRGSAAGHLDAGLAERGELRRLARRRGSLARDHRAESRARPAAKPGAAPARRAPGAGGAWTVPIVRSRALARLRRLGSRRRAEAAAAREATVEPPQAAPDPATGHALRTLRKDVANAVAALAPQQRVVVELAYFEGLSQTEIAERLEAPLGTVKWWPRQALLKLRERVPMEELP